MEGIQENKNFLAKLRKLFVGNFTLTIAKLLLTKLSTSIGTNIFVYIAILPKKGEFIKYYMQDMSLRL